MVAIPASLISALRTGDVIPLVGSGISQASGMASWNEIVGVLRDIIRSDSGLDEIPDLDMFEVPDSFPGTGAARAGVFSLLADAVGGGFQPNHLHALLSEIPFRTALTTNWDSLLEDSLRLSRRVNVIYDDDSARDWRESQATQIVKFHGSLNAPKSVIFALSDYSRLYQQPSVLMSLVRTLIATRPTLSMGFGMKDPFLKSLFHSVQAESGGEHYVALSDLDAGAARRGYLADIGLRVIRLEGTEVDAFGLSSFLQEVRDETYMEARNRLDRTGLLIRETKRLERYLGSERRIRCRASLGPLAVPPDDNLNIFGDPEVYATEQMLMQAVLDFLKNPRAKLRMICGPIDGGAHATGKGYEPAAYRARLGSLVKSVEGLGAQVEVAMTARPFDVNDWIAADKALIESRKSTLPDGRLYNYGRVELNPTVVGSAVSRFDSEFDALISLAGGVEASRRAFLESAKAELA